MTNDNYETVFAMACGCRSIGGLHKTLAYLRECGLTHTVAYRATEAALRWRLHVHPVDLLGHGRARLGGRLVSGHKRPEKLPPPGTDARYAALGFPYRVTLRLTKEQAERLEGLALLLGKGKQEVIRWLLEESEL